MPDLNYNHDSDGLPDAKFKFKMSNTGFPYTPGTGDPCSASTLNSSGYRFLLIFTSPRAILYG